MNLLFPNASQSLIALNPHLLQDSGAQRHDAGALDCAAKGKIKGLDGLARRDLPGVTVRFIGHRVRPLDPDSFAASIKGLLDGLRHSHIIEGDEPWRIRLETEQVKVSKFKDEKTVIEVFQ